mgnify:CR=1 FL=1
MTNIATIFKALGDDTRIEILRMLFGKSLCVCDIMDAFALTQPAISHHLKILKQAGIIADSKDGKWVFYSINEEAFQCLSAFFQEFSDSQGKQARISPRSPYKL